MPTVKIIKEDVQDLEGFDIDIICPDLDKEFRSHKTLDFIYGYSRAASNKMTVAQYAASRIPDYTVQVLNGNGVPVHGRTLLKTVRRSYA